MTDILKVACPHCGRRLNGDAGVRSHIIAKHGGKGRGSFKPTPADDDESFADRAIQAEIDRACGFANPDIDWLLP